ncbi:MAG TPA: hypothetical protein DDZ84_01690 [Firmicutes bacterium]|jgi:molybdopterin converting factor small subunit|nr:hypothetical protein [Bacillota bacterium]
MDPAPSRIKDMEMRIPSISVDLGAILDDIANAAGLSRGWERHALILVNGNPSRRLGGHAAVVRDGDCISVVRPMGGG